MTLFGLKTAMWLIASFQRYWSTSPGCLRPGAKDPGTWYSHRVLECRIELTTEQSLNKCSSKQNNGRDLCGDAFQDLPSGCWTLTSRGACSLPTFNVFPSQMIKKDLVPILINSYENIDVFSAVIRSGKISRLMNEEHFWYQLPWFYFLCCIPGNDNIIYK